MTRTIEELSAAELQKLGANTRMRQREMGAIGLGEKFAVCLIKLNAAVDQPGDYPALKAAIEAVTGVTEISLLVDGRGFAAIPAGTQQRIVVEGQLRLDDV